MVDIATLISNLGLMIVISGVFIYTHLEYRKDKKENHKRDILALENSSDAIVVNSKILKNTEDMHRIMDSKIDDIYRKIEELENEYAQGNGEIFKILEDVKKELEGLRKLQSLERSD